MLLVALRKESVDRNCGCLGRCHCWESSLSARRAWIEITGSAWVPEFTKLSLSARRAWIEILFHAACFALPESRSPQGERG